jgi:hypothetical protein
MLGPDAQPMLSPKRRRFESSERWTSSWAVRAFRSRGSVRLLQYDSVNQRTVDVESDTLSHDLTD